MEDLKYSKITAKLFLKKAEEDLKSARSLFESKIWSDTCYHSQQASEKSLKAVLMLTGKREQVAEHLVASYFMGNIVGGLVYNKGWKDKLLKVARYAGDLEQYWIKTRYPFTDKRYIWDPTKEYKKKDAEDAIKKAEFVYNTIRDFLKDRYGIKGLEV
jgi:HEPN domain-containing protein